MKNPNFLTVMLGIMALITAFGCSKDEDEKTLGTLTVGPKIANLTNGFILNYGDCADFYLCTAGLNYEVENGKGHFVNFMVYPRSSETFAGSYTFSDREDTTGTFEYCEYYFNLLLEDGYITDCKTYGYATDGVITISQNGDVYTIEISCAGLDYTNQTTVTITAAYSGALKVYLEQGKKSTDRRKFFLPVE